MSTMSPFAMDKNKKNLIIFRKDRGKDLGLYIWVFLRNDRVQFSPVSEFARYSKITGEPMDVSGNYDEEIVKGAVNVIRNLSEEETAKQIDNYNKLVEDLGGSEAWKEREKKMLELAENAKSQKQMVYWY